MVEARHCCSEGGGGVGHRHEDPEGEHRSDARQLSHQGRGLGGGSAECSEDRTIPVSRWMEGVKEDFIVIKHCMYTLCSVNVG